MEGPYDGQTPPDESTESGIHTRPYRHHEPPAETARLEDVGPQVSDWLPAALEELLPSLGCAVHQLIDDSPYLTDHVHDVCHLREFLLDAGVGAFDGVYSDLAAYYAVRFHGREIDEETFPGTDQRRQYVSWLRENIIDDLVGFCTQRGLYDSGVDDLEDGPLRLLELADLTPRLVIELDASTWKEERHRETRQRTLDALSTLADRCHIDLVVPPSLYAHLDRLHPEWCDSHLSAGDYLTDNRNSNHQTSPSNADSQPLEVWECIRNLQAGGGRLRLLANLSETGWREQRDLVCDREVGLAEESISRYLGDLEELDLIAVDRRGRYNRVRLTPHGQTAQELITADYRLRDPFQSRLDELHLTATPHRSAGTVCPADPHKIGEGEKPPTADEWLAATGDATKEGYIQWLGDTDTERHLRPWDLHRRLLAPSRVEGVNLVDDPIEKFDDGRVSYLSGFEDEVLAISQWGGPLPTLVRLATTLLSPKAFSKIITPSAVGDDFENVFDGAFEDTLGTLQQRTQIGWFGEEQLEYDQFRSRFLGVRATLLERLAELTNSDDSDARAALFADAHGLLTTATHLYHALDLDVTINIRFPDTETLLRKDDVRDDFKRFIERTIPKHGAYGVHSAYRCMFESREDKVNFAMPPEVDSTDPAVTTTATWIFTGPAISATEDVIRNALEATAEDDALDERPYDPITFDIPVAVANTYAGIRHVVQEFAERKHFNTVRGSRDLRHVVRLLLAVTGQGVLRGSPYDVAEAMLHLARANTDGQPIRVRDLEHGVAHLPASRLLPDLPPSVGKIVKVLLQSDEPIGRSEIISRAGISASTYDRRIGELEAFDFVERTNDRKWRAHLSPWFVGEGSRSHPDFDAVTVGGMQSVLWEIIGVDDQDDDVCNAISELDYRTLCDRFGWLRPWLDVLETLTAHLDACDERGLLGEAPIRVRLGEPPPESDFVQGRFPTLHPGVYG